MTDHKLLSIEFEETCGDCGAEKNFRASLPTAQFNYNGISKFLDETAKWVLKQNAMHSRGCHKEKAND